MNIKQALRLAALMGGEIETDPATGRVVAITFVNRIAVDSYTDDEVPAAPVYARAAGD